MQIFFSIFWWIYFCIFFSGYPLIYTFFYFTNKKTHLLITKKVYPLLPLSYAFVATSFWLLMFYAGRMNFVLDRIISAWPSALVIIYSLAALLFWLPVFRKNSSLSFLHSLPLFLLPFFNMLIKRYKHKIVDHDYIISLVKIYTAGVVVYIIAIAFLIMIKWLLSRTILLKHHKA